MGSVDGDTTPGIGVHTVICLLDNASDMDESSRPRLLSHVLVPVANEDDARETARALAAYEPTAVTTLHVVEKGGGAPDKTPVWVSEETAESAFAAFKGVLPMAESHTAYGSDIVETILETAAELDVSAIAYRPRGGGRVMRFLSGDLTLKLVTEADCPVITLPPAEDDA